MSIQRDAIVPVALDDEEAVLGSVIQNGQAIDEIATSLQPGDFYRETGQWIYEAMLRLYDRGEGIDFLTLADELRATGKLTDCGGMGYLTDLINVVPTSAHVRYYAEKVRDAAERRRLIRATGQINGIAYDDGLTSTERRDKAEAILFGALSDHEAARPFRTAMDLSCAGTQRQERTADPRGAGIPTGLVDLDAKLGELQRGDVTVIAARPSVGKTSMAATWALNAAVKGYSVTIFSLEMKDWQLEHRFVTMLTGISQHRLRMPAARLADDELARINRGRAAFANLPVSICDRRGLTAIEISRLAREQYRRQPFDLLVIDYLQLIRDAPRAQNRNLSLGDVNQTLKELAGRLDVALVMGCQLSRDTEKHNGGKPLLSHLRDSGTTEQDADNVIGLYRADYQAVIQNAPPVMAAEAIVLKQRNGETGPVDVGFYGSRSMFVDLADVRAINQDSRRVA